MVVCVALTLWLVIFYNTTPLPTTVAPMIVTTEPVTVAPSTTQATTPAGFFQPYGRILVDGQGNWYVVTGDRQQEAFPIQQPQTPTQGSSGKTNSRALQQVSSGRRRWMQHQQHLHDRLKQQEFYHHHLLPGNNFSSNSNGTNVIVTTKLDSSDDGSGDKSYAQMMAEKLNDALSRQIFLAELP